MHRRATQAQPDYVDPAIPVNHTMLPTEILSHQEIRQLEPLLSGHRGTTQVATASHAPLHKSSLRGMPPEMLGNILSKLDHIGGAWACFPLPYQFVLTRLLAPEAPQLAVSMLGFNPHARTGLESLVVAPLNDSDSQNDLLALATTLWMGARHLIAPQHHALRMQAFDKLGEVIARISPNHPDKKGLLRELIEFGGGTRHVTDEELERPLIPQLGIGQRQLLPSQFEKPPLLMALLKVGQIVAAHASELDDAGLRGAQQARNELVTLAWHCTHSIVKDVPELEENPRAVPWHGKIAGHDYLQKTYVPVLRDAIAHPDFPVEAYAARGMATTFRADDLRSSNRFGTQRQTTLKPDVQLHNALDRMLVDCLLRHDVALETRMMAWQKFTGECNDAQIATSEMTNLFFTNLTAFVSTNSVTEFLHRWAAFIAKSSMRHATLQQFFSNASQAFHTELKSNPDACLQYVSSLKEPLLAGPASHLTRKSFLQQAARGSAMLADMPDQRARTAWDDIAGRTLQKYQIEDGKSIENLDLSLQAGFGEGDAREAMAYLRRF